MAPSMGKGIASIGELLVEFVCDSKDARHRRAGHYSGPYPSGAAGIFIDQAARCAARTIFIGAVGADAFGHVVLDRFARDAVDTSLVATVAGWPTGSAFVSYNSDGSRDFVFNILHSAAAQFEINAAVLTRLTEFSVGIIHVSGSGLFDEVMAAKILHVCKALHDKGVHISFDPNVRKELIDSPVYLRAVHELMNLCTYFLPSEEDAEILFPGQQLAGFAPKLFANSTKYVVLKRGDKGAAAISSTGEHHTCAAHTVEVADPTGAGDCFCATFVTLLATAGYPLQEALRYANAAGALAVQKIGPMEGNSSVADIAAFLT